jgi:putative ABC transport system substrate-binding protein
MVHATSDGPVMRSVLKGLVMAMLVGIFQLAPVSTAQPTAVREVPRIGYLGLRPIDESAASIESITALKDGLRDLGYVEGKDYVLEVRVANNDPTRYPALTAELTKLQVKLIVAASTPAAVAIHKANPTMPVVVRGPDIIGAGLADSASRPGGVVTGIDELAAGLSDKRLRLLKQAVPTISRVAVLSSAPTEGGHLQAFAEAELAAREIGATVRPFRISASTDLAPIFAGLRGDSIDAVFCSGGVLPRPVQQRIVELAAQHRLPALYAQRGYVELGGLMSYAYRNAEMFRVAATYVDKILKGAKPGELALTIWDRHYVTVNARTASALGLMIPAAVLSQADIIK